MPNSLEDLIVFAGSSTLKPNEAKSSLLCFMMSQSLKNMRIQAVDSDKDGAVELVDIIRYFMIE